ncbi:S1C family serine protease, partial [Mycolicibacterium mucogenicum]
RNGGRLKNTNPQVLTITRFAIPADTVAEVVHELITYGAVERASLGVTVARRAVDGAPGGHALVITAVKANVAGPLERGDAIIAVGDRAVSTQNELLRALRRDVANRRVAVVVMRDGVEVSVECRPRGVRTFG